MARIVLVCISVAFLAVLLYGVYLKESAVLAGLFVVVLLVSAALYLFSFTNISEFSIEAFATKARFLRETVERAKHDLDELEELKRQLKNNIDELEKVRSETEQKLLKIQDDVHNLDLRSWLGM